MPIQTSSRPSSTSKKTEKKDKKEDDSKKKKGKESDGMVTVIDRFVLFENNFQTKAMINSISSAASVLKCNVPAMKVASIVEQIEKSRPPSVSKGKGKRGQSPKGDKNKPSPRDNNNDRKTPSREKSPANGGKREKKNSEKDAQQSTVDAAPPPPDLQATFSIGLETIRSARDVDKYFSVIANTASVMELTQQKHEVANV